MKNKTIEELTKRVKQLKPEPLYVEVEYSDGSEGYMPIIQAHELLHSGEVIGVAPPKPKKNNPMYQFDLWLHIIWWHIAERGPHEVDEHLP